MTAAAGAVVFFGMLLLAVLTNRSAYYNGFLDGARYLKEGPSYPSKPVEGWHGWHEVRALREAAGFVDLPELACMGCGAEVPKRVVVHMAAHARSVGADVGSLQIGCCKSCPPEAIAKFEQERLEAEQDRDSRKGFGDYHGRL